LAPLALATQSLPRKLCVGLFADGPLQPRWLVEAFAKVAASDFAEIALIATADGQPAAPGSALSRLYNTLDRRLFAPGADPDEQFELARHVAHRSLRTLDAGVPLDCDLDVAFALGEIDDARLDGLARYGVWRFRADGGREVAAGEPVSGSALLVRPLPQAPARVAYQSWACTYPLSIARNRAQLLHKTSEFAVRALRELQRSGSGWLTQCRIVPENAPRLHASLAPALAKRVLRRALDKALRVEQWFLAFRFCAPGAAARAVPANLEGYTRIVPPVDRIWADPFALERNGRYFVFFEEMLAGGKGHIAMLELEPGGRWTAPVRVLERDYHLSYPFLLERDGELYMIPESVENGTVEAWRCVDFPLRWKLERRLLEGVRLVDATVHRGAERWWMFANAAPPDWSLNDELHVFHAGDLFGEWRSHLRNPVKSDVRCARPAGSLYWRNGVLHRPAQICAPHYGAGLSINSVLRLTPHEYAERPVERVLPGGSDGVRGIHTVNRAGELTVIDACVLRRRF
jgi:hypothetical protein